MRRAAWLAFAAASCLGVAGSEVGPGSYCPLPEGDEPPACLNPAQEHYAEFFSGLREGVVDDSALAEVEGDLAGDDLEERYEALSALAYAYYVLSRRAVPGSGDAALAVRLERWNTLMGDTYRSSPDEQFRLALREAAQDLSRRSRPVPVRCADAKGNITQCQSTDAVQQAVADVRDRTGIRGAVSRLIQRIFGGGD
jgi:hypothetical protein